MADITSAPFDQFALFIDKEDQTELVIPDSIQFRARLTESAEANLKFAIRGVESDYNIQGGDRIDLYLPDVSYPVFSGHAVRHTPVKLSAAQWEYMVECVSWESVFYRERLTTTIRNLTYEEAANTILQHPSQTYPTVIRTTVSNQNSVLDGNIGFYAINGAYAGDVFDFIASLTDSAWRVVPGASVDEFVVEFYDPRVYTGTRAFEFTNDSESFSWARFKPRLNVNDIITTQVVRGAFVPADTADTALWRGDNLNSKFPIPLRPYDNEPRVIMVDNFETNVLNTNLWTETDVAGNYVYNDGAGFCQFEPDGGNTDWVGILSRALVSRGNRASMVVDFTWDTNGEIAFGFTEETAVGANTYEFLEAGVYTDSDGDVYLAAGGTSLGAYTDLTLTQDEQYRFRIILDETEGCKIQYQTGANVYTRNWITMVESAVGDTSALNAAVFTKTGGFALDMAKMSNPYLGVKLEVDRGKGFLEERVGVYPADEDTDAVIQDEQVLSFFGSDPGPSTIPPAPTAKEFTVTDLANDICSVTGGHGIATGSQVRFETTGTEPSGLTDNSTYYLHAINYTTFKLYDSEANAEAGGATGRVDITDAGSGTHTVIPTEWEDKDSDYKNIRLTYNQGNRIVAQYQKHSLVNELKTLFGGGDNGIREAPLITDDNLVSYDAAISRAKTEVDNNSNILKEIDAKTDWITLQAAAMNLPIAGDIARFRVNISDVDYDLEGDIPVVAMEVLARAGSGGKNFDLTFKAGYVQNRFRRVLKALTEAGEIVAINEAATLYDNDSDLDTVTLSESTTATEGDTANWGDSRQDREFSFNLATNRLTTTTNARFETGTPVRFSTTDTLPTGLVADTRYWLYKNSRTEFFVYTTESDAVNNTGNNIITPPDVGVGTHTVHVWGWKYGVHTWQSFTTEFAALHMAWQVTQIQELTMGWRMPEATTLGMAWKLANTKSQDFSWKLSNIISQAMAWKNVGASSLGMSWHLLQTPSVPPPVPTHDFLFDEGSGSTIADSKGGASLSLNGSYTWDSEGVSIDQRTVGNFISSANGSYYDLGASGTDGFSLALWVDVANWASGSPSTLLLGLGNGSSDDYGVNLDDYSFYISRTNFFGDRIEFVISTGTASQKASRSYTFPTGSPVLIGVSFRRSDNEIHVRARNAGSWFSSATTATGAMQNVSSFELRGRLQEGMNNYGGDVNYKRLLIWDDRILTSDEWTQVYDWGSEGDEIT